MNSETGPRKKWGMNVMTVSETTDTEDGQEPRFSLWQRLLAWGS